MKAHHLSNLLVTVAVLSCGYSATFCLTFEVYLLFFVLFFFSFLLFSELWMSGIPVAFFFFFFGGVVAAV